MDYTNLSKEISYALRHNPDKYNLTLDNDGWVSINCLISSLSKKREFADLQKSDIAEMISVSLKKRHEIVGDNIRAIYGHSLEQKINRVSSKPPSVLYHGTAKKFIRNIFIEGLISKERQYVHLSDDIETATVVGKRRDSQPVILKVNANQAHNDGILFYFADKKIWLADSIPVKYLEII